MLLLKPGDSARIVGTAPVTLVPAGAAYQSMKLGYKSSNSIEVEVVK